MRERINRKMIRCVSVLFSLALACPAVHAQRSEGWKSELWDLESRIEGQLKELMKEKEALEKTNEALEKRLDRIADDNEEMELQLRYLETKLKESSTNNAILKKVVSRLKGDRVKLKGEMEDLEDEYGAARDEMGTLSEEFEKAKRGLTASLSQKESELKEAVSRLAESDAERERFESRFRSIQSGYFALEKEKVRLEDEIVARPTWKGKYNEALDRHAKAVSEREAGMDRLTEAMLVKESEIANLNRMLEAARAKVTPLTKNIIEYKSANLALEKDMSTFHDKYDRLERTMVNVNQEAVNAQDQIKLSDDRLRQARNELMDALYKKDDVINELKTDIAHKNSNISELMKTIEQQKSKIKEWGFTAARSDARVNSVEGRLRKELRRAKGETGKAHKKFLKTSDKLGEALSNLNHTQDDLTKEISAKDTEIHELRLALSRMDSENRVAQEEREKLKAISTEMLNNNASLQENINTLRVERFNLKKEISDISRKFAPSKSEIDALNARLQEADESGGHAVFEKQMELNNLKSSLSHRGGEINTLKAQLGKMGVEKDTLVSELNEAKDEVKSIYAILNDSKAGSSALWGELQSLRDERVRLKKRVKVLNRDLTSAKNEMASLGAQSGAQISRRHVETREVKAKLKKLESANKALSSQIRSLTAARSDIDQEKTLIAEGYTRAKEEIDALTSKLQEYQNAKERTPKNLRDAQKEISKLKKENAGVRKKIDDLRVLGPKSIETSTELSTIDKAEIYRSLGYLYSLEGNMAQSIKYYKKSVKMNPGDRDVCYNLGYLYAQKRDYGKAVEYYKKAISGKATDKDVYYNLAVIYTRHLKDEKRSNAYYEKFLNY